MKSHRLSGEGDPLRIGRQLNNKYVLPRCRGAVSLAEKLPRRRLEVLRSQERLREGIPFVTSMFF